MLLHFPERRFSRLLQLLFVGGRTAAHDVAYAGEQVLEDIGTQDGFARDDAQIPGDALAFNIGSGRHEHAVTLIDMKRA
ncbi:hypothetical protein D3C87_2074150 [compost metagenome]